MVSPDTVKFREKGTCVNIPDRKFSVVQVILTIFTLVTHSRPINERLDKMIVNSYS